MQPLNGENTKSNAWVIYPATGFVCISFALLGYFISMHWTTISELFYESSLAKYETMTGDRGPVTYLVQHDGLLDTLQTLAQSSPDILGVEQDKRSNVAKIAFTAADASSIASIEALPGVTGMLRRNVPMICH